METNNTQPSTNSQEETVMSNIQQLFHNFIESGGLPKVTAFKKHLDQLINTEIKPLCSSRGKASGVVSNGDNDWRREQKGMFSGRGAKWVKVTLDAIEETLKRLEGNGIDCSAYRTWTTQAGYAWVRYSGPRVLDKVAMAAFEVRTEGSKIDHPQQLHYVPNDELIIERLDGTPHSKGIEVIKNQATPDSDDEISVSDVEDVTVEPEATDEVVTDEVIETETDIPDSDDPEVWEAYLESQGLGIDQLEDEEDFDQLNDDMF